MKRRKGEMKMKKEKNEKKKLRKKMENKKEKRKNRTKKGLVISFDSIIALSVMFMMVIGVNAMLGKTNSQTFEELNSIKMTNDILAAMEKTGAIERAVMKDDPASLEKFLKETRQNDCYMMRVYDNENKTEVAMVKQGCSAHGEDVSVNSRTIIFGNREHLAVLSSWSRGS
ncbi:Uncharacterised protein [Candidatus Gugararchaeum adminiculabundum]|nr:Uncharacterised protein [Candidatus Gugararchaeum adminiculabundum]